MSFADRMLNCQRCGRRFVFTVEEQRRIATGDAEVAEPELCPSCRRADEPQVNFEQPPPPASTHAAPELLSPPLPPPPAGEPIETTPSDEFAIPSDVQVSESSHPAPVVLPGRRAGHVKWFDVRKGFGFIVQEDGGEIFVHHSGIAGEGYKRLRDGEPVEYEIETTQKGPQAINVLPIEDAEAGSSPPGA